MTKQKPRKRFTIGQIKKACDYITTNLCDLDPENDSDELNDFLMRDNFEIFSRLLIYYLESK